MSATLRIQPLSIKDDREIRVEDFHPWSYNLHFLASEEDWSYHLHRHYGCFELVYLIEGHLTHRLNGETRDFSQGDLLAVGEEDVHAIEGRGFSYANLIIPTVFWRRLLISLDLEDPLGDPSRCRGKTVALPPEDRSSFVESLETLFRLQETQQGERLFRRFLARLIFDVYWEDRPTAEDRPLDRPRWWDNLVRRLEGQGDLPADPKELALWAGRSREHVARSCRRYLGETPSTWLNRLRLDKAALLLRKTNLDISDIVYSLGFESLSHFYRLFTSRFGAPPKAFRNRYGDAP